MSLTEEEKTQLVNASYDAKTKAYAKYSKFHVGAALMAEDGTIYTGCNVENVSYGLTNCAERTAYFKAVSEGALKFKGIALSSSDLGDGKFITPCGACRQVMAEFGDIPVIMTNNLKETKESTVAELLPLAFDDFK